MPLILNPYILAAGGGGAPGPVVWDVSRTPLETIFTNGNKTANMRRSARHPVATQGHSTGKRYFEIVYDGALAYGQCGIAGVFTEFGSPTALSSSWPRGTPHEFELRMVGTTIGAYQNGGLLKEFTDSSLTSGKAGLQAYGALANSYSEFAVDKY